MPSPDPSANVGDAGSRTGRRIGMPTLVRWNPFQELDAMERRMRRMLDDLGLVPGTLPAADVYETESEYVFEVDAPGFEERELTVEVSDHMLRVKGEHAEEKETKEKTFRLHERLEKSFERRFELPPEADPDSIAAEFAKGVLTVHAAKAKVVEPREVPIAKT
jgi:HSP20 family protein